MPLFPATGFLTLTGIELLVARFARLRVTSGLRAALAYLSELTGRRCIAVLRLAGDQPVAASYFDRADRNLLAPRSWPAAVLGACLSRDGVGRLCEMRSKRPRASSPAVPWCEVAATDDAGDYVCQSVPVIDDRGELHGSLCLFDLRARRVPEADLALLVQLANELAREPEVLRASLMPLRARSLAAVPAAARQHPALRWRASPLGADL